MHIKQIPKDEMLIFGVGDSFHGLTSGVWSLQNGTEKRSGYGLDDRLQTNINPSTGKVLRYGVVEDIEACLAEHHGRTAAVIIECLHGGLRMDVEIRYSRAVYDLSRKYGILFIADEVRQGAGKTGKFHGFEHLGSDVHPDMVCMGKSIAGGFYPCSYVLGTNEVMELVGTAENASTFGFTPIGIAATNTTLDILDRPGYMERGTHFGEWFQSVADKWIDEYEFVTEAVGCGMDMCIYIDENHPTQKVTARKVAALCVQKGLLVVQQKNRVRMSPPLMLSDEEMEKAMGIINEALEEVLLYEAVPGEFWTGPM